ncbi:TIGR02099 family protein [Betaproteobacteria bacterium GR16-43]|nr:TIGR02099 family protein [Betaproteobacteria bacterium GR16-43]
MEALGGGLEPYNNAKILKSRSSPRPRIKTITRFCFRFLAGAGLTLVIAFAAIVLWLRYVTLPDVESWRPKVIASIESASGMAVEVKHLQGGWGGLRPRVSMQGFTLSDRKGRAVLAFENAQATLSWWALLLGQVRLHDVEFERPELVLRRGTDGLIYLADKPLNRAGPGDGEFSRWLLEQPRFQVHNASLTWKDEMSGAAEIRLSEVEITMRRKGSHHLAALTARPPANLAKNLDLRAELRIDRQGDRLVAVGALYGESTDADLARFRDYLPLPDTLRSGFGSLRVWGDVTHEGVKAVTADVSLRDVRAQLAADAQPLELASVSGRVEYRAEPGGFYVGTEDLRFRTAAGLDAKPASFSLLRRAEKGEAARGEFRADGLDLKVAVTLLEHLPIPRELREQVRNYAPRGVITQAALLWTGESPAKATALEVRGRFENLALASVDGRPGVSGLTGSLDGTEKGGALQIASKHATLEIASFFRAPLAFASLDAKARWKRVGKALEVTVDDLRFTNADASGQASGTWRSLPDAGHASPGFLDIKGSFTDAKTAAVVNYLPVRYEHTQRWLDAAILAGTSARANFEVKGDLWHFPFPNGQDGHFLIEGDLKGGKLRYHPDWPVIDAIDGSLRFEGRRMEIRADSATIFQSRMKGTSAIVEDFGANPPVLVVTGQVDTAGPDGARFLRESPLVNGPGAFTRAIQVEGPARLGLRLTYPLWGTDPVRVSGDYTFAGATATLGKSLTMSGIKGRLAFTEKSVRAPELTGTMFNQPATVRINSQPEGGVLTTVEGRISNTVLGAFVPEGINAHLEGAFDWKARVVSGAEGSDLTLESDLKGLAAKLPAPFDKAAADARALTVNIRKLGSPEELTVATLAGAGRGFFATRGAPGAERWQAALAFGTSVDTPPLKDGIWLYGDLARLDVDQWLSVFPTREGASAPGGGDAGPSLRGFDLRLKEVLFTQREFHNLAVSLERSGTEWKGHLEGAQISGDVAWNPVGKGSVVARLDRLTLQPSPKADPGAANSSEGGELPALDIVAERFVFKGTDLGRLELKAEHAEAEWRIGKLNIVNGHAQFLSSGAWRRTGTGSITTLDLSLESNNLNALFAQFGYGDYLKRGTATLKGKLAWPGFPYEFSPAILSGSFRLDAKSGQFAKIEPGAGKLLGLLSLQSLPRRVTLDFRDVVSEGFAFESITANVRLARGILLTDDLEINGPAAFVGMSGEVSLPQETQRLTLRVVPEVGESVALAATLIGTPVLGLSTLVVSKLLQNPLGKVVAYEYQVTGSWDNPSVTRTSAPPPKAAAAEAPARATP